MVFLVYFKVIYFNKKILNLFLIFYLLKLKMVIFIFSIFILI